MKNPLPVIGISSDLKLEEGRLRVRVPVDYIDAVVEAGGLPLIIPATLPPELLREHVARCDGILFMGGEDYPPDWYGQTPHPKTQIMHPVRAAADRELMQAALSRGLPVLAICGGHQLLNIACGGTLIQHVENATEHGGSNVHTVTIRGGRILRKLFGEGPIQIISHHHQAVPDDGVGDGLIVTARADDGTIEALEGADPKTFLLGVQWHPERDREGQHRKTLFRAFVRASA